MDRMDEGKLIIKICRSEADEVKEVVNLKEGRMKEFRASAEGL